MLISERAGAEILSSVGISREQARLLLLTGVAGAGQRVGRSTGYDEHRVREVAARPVLPTMTTAVIGVRHRLAEGRLPWVATVSGLVVFGGEATGWRPAEDGSSVVDLERPGSWYEHVAQRWFAFGRGRHWCLWDPWRSRLAVATPAGPVVRSLNLRPPTPGPRSSGQTAGLQQ